MRMNAHMDVVSTLTALAHPRLGGGDGRVRAAIDDQPGVRCEDRSASVIAAVNSPRDCRPGSSNSRASAAPEQAPSSSTLRRDSRRRDGANRLFAHGVLVVAAGAGEGAAPAPAAARAMACRMRRLGPAATDVAAHRLVDVGGRLVWRALQQGRGRHDLSRLAIAALRRVLGQPRLEQRSPARRGGQPLDRRDGLCPDRRDRGHAGARRRGVEMDRAVAALSKAAPEFWSPSDRACRAGSRARASPARHRRHAPRRSPTE
jgi:hypothetical protein